MCQQETEKQDQTKGMVIISIRANTVAADEL